MAELERLEKLVAELSEEFYNPDNQEFQNLKSENLKLKYRLTHLKRALEESKPAKTAVADDFFSTECSLFKIVKTGFQIAIENAFPNIEHEAIIGLAKDEEKFDYQCNSALSLSKSVQPKSAPRAIAETIMKNLPSAFATLLEKTEIAGPGFINVKISTSILSNRAFQALQGSLPAPKTKKEVVIIDYSSPNIAKDMHVGHLRSTIIGDSLGNLLEYLGHEVKRVNHVGDWGTQFGMLIAHLQDEFPDYSNQTPSIKDLEGFYKQSKKRFDEDEVFKKRAYENVVKLQAKEEAIYKAWQAICQASRENFEYIYRQLNISPKLTEKGESFYNDLMKELMKDLKERDLLTLDDGRYIYFPKDCEIPMTLIKSDGGFTYDTSDLACLKYRLDHENADRILYRVV